MTAPRRTVHLQAAEQSLTFSRTFDAPAALVFRAHVEPELLARWMGPQGTRLRLDHFDARTGGAFRYAVVGRQEWVFFGSYHDVSAPTRIVHTWQPADDARPTLESLAFVELDGGHCRLDGLSVYTSAEHCREMLAFDESGEGMDENFTRLDALLAELTGITSR